MKGSERRRLTDGRRRSSVEVNERVVGSQTWLEGRVCSLVFGHQGALFSFSHLPDHGPGKKRHSVTTSDSDVALSYNDGLVKRSYLSETEPLFSFACVELGKDESRLRVRCLARTEDTAETQ